MAESIHDAAAVSGPSGNPLFDDYPDPLFACDLTGRITDCNQAFERLCGWSAPELREYADPPFVHPDDGGRFDHDLRRAIAGESHSGTLRCLDRSGSEFELDVTYLPVHRAGQVVQVFGIVRRIGEGVAGRAALESSERHFRGLFERAGVGLSINDLEGRYLDANPAYCEMVGYTLEELRAIDFLEITHVEDRAPNRRDVDALIAGEVPAVHVEKRYLTKSGEELWVRVDVSLVSDADGGPLYVAVTAEDISDVKAASERLVRSEKLRRLAGGLALVGGWSIEASDRTLYWSDEIYTILDAPPGEEPPLDDSISMYPPDDRRRLEAALDACFADGVPFDLELEIDTFAGRRIPVRAIGEPERDENGSILRAVGAFQDITDLRAATSEAEAAAARLTTTLESMTDAFYTLDTEWRFTFLNERAAVLIQRQPDELIGRSIWDEFVELDDTDVGRAYRQAMRDRRTQVIEEFHYPPLDTWFSINIYPSEQGLAVYFRDVTDVQAARIDREEREAVLRRQAALLDQAQDAILVRDIDNRITYWNASAERIYGWTASEAIGASGRDLLYDNPDEFDAATATVFRDGSWNGEITNRTRAGERRVVAGRWTLVRDEQGRPEAVLAINTDITDQKRLEQQLLRAQRMESIGTLAGGIAHDLNNVLSPVLLAAELLALNDPDEESARLLETISTSAQRGADLVTQVLSFARGVEGRRAAVDISQLFDDLEVVVRDTFPKNIRLDIDPEIRVGPVLGDSTQIQQVLLNLVVNARDAMPDGGELTVRASEVILDAQYVASMPGSAPGEYVLIDVEDTGTGMPPDVRERVFEPFFTTKAHGSGTGLGLSTSAAIVDSHGGSIRVYSEPGKGSRFRVYLPMEAGAAAPAEAAPRLDLPRGSGQTILIVDDEAAVRAMTRQTLEAYGYQAIEAGNGAEAVATFAQHRHRIDLVLTDMMMPIMDGPATIHALRNIDPDLPIIGASGLHGNGRVVKAADAGVEHFLPKPYTSRGLLEAIDRVLGSP